MSYLKDLLLAERVREIVARVCAPTPDDLLFSNRRPLRRARYVMVEVLRAEGLSMVRIAAVCGAAHHSSIVRAFHRLEPGASELVEETRAELRRGHA